MATASRQQLATSHPLAVVPNRKKFVRLTLWPLVAATFFMVSGGTYGTEDIVHGAGYGRAILILLLTPLLWSLPNFLFWGRTECCGDWAGALAVANFYGFLLERLTLTTPSPLSRGSRLQRFRGFGEVSSQHREYGNLDAAQKKIRQIFSRKTRDGGNGAALPPRRCQVSG